MSKERKVFFTNEGATYVSKHVDEGSEDLVTGGAVKEAIDESKAVIKREVVRVDTSSQGLSETEKQNARTNIGITQTSPYLAKGNATVDQLNAGPEGIQNGWSYVLTDSGTLSDGSLAVAAGDTVAWDGEAWFKISSDSEIAQKVLAGNLASAFDPTRTEENKYIAYKDICVHEGKLYLFTSDHYGAWDASDATRIPISNLAFLRKSNIFGSFFVCDDKNNVVLLICDGHVLTKNFDSSKVNVKQTESLCSFSIKDENGFVVLAVRNGHIVTKNFDSEQLVNNIPKNYEKTVAVFGGSLSKMPESEIAKDMWRTDLKMDVTTYGQNGAGFVPRTGFPGIQAQVASAPVKDVYILWASTNDFTNDQPVGEYTDYTYLDNYDQSKLNTQCGGINYCIKTLTEKNPHCEIYFFTGLDFFTRESGYNPFSTDTNNLGKTYQEYVDAQLKCCELFSIPVFDQNKACGFNVFNYTQYYKDNLHLNEDGYRRLGKMQVEFLSNGLN